MSLFDKQKEDIQKSMAPLADRMRPKTLSEFAGQDHLLGKGKPLRSLIERGNLSSLILWGPPGCGKTTLGRLIAEYSKSHFIEFSAVTSGVKEVRQVISEAKERFRLSKQRTILFIDEIHRFNKAQQDAFLPSVENGTIILIGATTENPGFSVNAPLISRSQVYNLHALSNDNIRTIIEKAIKQYSKHKFSTDAIKHIVKNANGDARNALNALELAASLKKNVDLKVAEEAVQRKAIYYDKKGDWHYDTISAFIKSMRGSDPDATLYWLARMIKSGEDPMFIARRMVIFSSEDINMANSGALMLATSAMQAVHMIGMPEAQIILAHAAVYLATAQKSTATYAGLMNAFGDIDTERLEPVPLHMRNPVNKVMKDIGAGKGHIRYKWNDPGSHKKQTYLPENLIGKRYYFPEKYESLRNKLKQEKND